MEWQLITRGPIKLKPVAGGLMPATWKSSLSVSIDHRVMWCFSAISAVPTSGRTYDFASSTGANHPRSWAFHWSQRLALARSPNFPTVSKVFRPSSHRWKIGIARTRPNPEATESPTTEPVAVHPPPSSPLPAAAGQTHIYHGTSTCFSLKNLRLENARKYSRFLC